MDKHWDAYCTLSLVHFLAFDAGSGEGPILESIAKVADDDFFSGIEVARVNDPGVRAQAARLMEQSHLEVGFGAHPMILGGKLNVNSLDASVRKTALDALKGYCVQAAELGAKRFVMLSGPDPGPADHATAMKIIADSLRELYVTARQNGLEITLETFDAKVDKKALVGPTDEAILLAAEIKRDFPGFGLLYDQAHGVLLDEEPERALGAMKEHLVHVHVGNCVKVPGRPAFGDNHPRFGFPGGENDVAELAEFIQAMFAVGYLKNDPEVGGRPWVGFEVKPQTGETAAAVIANVKRSWREAWARARSPQPVF
jgi:sugar phosphate isomerase/epimerase